MLPQAKSLSELLGLLLFLPKRTWNHRNMDGKRLLEGPCPASCAEGFGGPRAGSSPSAAAVPALAEGDSAHFSPLPTRCYWVTQTNKSTVDMVFSSRHRHPVPSWVMILVCKAKPCCWRMWHLTVRVLKSIICVWTSSNASRKIQGHPWGSHWCGLFFFFFFSLLHVTNSCSPMDLSELLAFVLW